MPANTVVTVQGIDGPGVTIETDCPLTWASQILAPSKAMPLGLPARLLATVVTAPAGWLGSIRNRLPGRENPVTRTFPMAMRTRSELSAPVHVSRSFPSLARTRWTDADP